MELRHLRYFVAVAEDLHFGRAARRLHISQPPLSQQIAALEEEIGARLLERTSRSVALTEAGHAFLARAYDILEAARRASAEARAASRGLRGRLQVGFVGPAVDGLLPPAILAYRETAPDVALELSEMGTREQLEALDAGRLDVGFVRAFGPPASGPARGLRLEVLVRERYVAALPSGHALARRRALDLADLASLPLIMYPRATAPALYDAVTAMLEQAGAGPSAASTTPQEARSKHVAVALVAAGLGAALVPESTARARRAGVAFRPIREPIGDHDAQAAPGPSLPLVEIAMAHDPSRATPTLERFMDAVRSEARRMAHGA